jgi:hypothetical protein
VRALRIPRPQPGEHAPYHGAYVAKIAGDDAAAALATQSATLDRALRAIPEEHGTHRYAPDKWSVKELVGHLVDSERIFSYRALRFARGDATPLPGFDENAYVPAGRFDARPLDDLRGEFLLLRSATLALFRSFDAAALSREGVASGHRVTVRALAWVIAGHAGHHLDVLRDRYALPAKAARGARA